MPFVADDPHRVLLDRATAALERIDGTFAQQSQAFDRMERESREYRAQASARQEQLMRRFERSENLFIKAISDIDLSLQRNAARLDDMGEAIRADRQAVLSVLDRLGPAPG